MQQRRHTAVALPNLNRLVVKRLPRFSQSCFIILKRCNSRRPCCPALAVQQIKLVVVHTRPPTRQTLIATFPTIAAISHRKRRRNEGSPRAPLESFAIAEAINTGYCVMRTACHFGHPLASPFPLLALGAKNEIGAA